MADASDAAVTLRSSIPENGKRDQRETVLWRRAAVDKGGGGRRRKWMLKVKKSKGIRDTGGMWPERAEKGPWPRPPRNKEAPVYKTGKGKCFWTELTGRRRHVDKKTKGA